MNETQPQYFKEFHNDFMEFKKHVDKRFDHLDNKIESEINGLALIIKDTVATKEDIKDMATKEDIRDMATKEDIKDMATKLDVKEILAHIGRYEIRAQNHEHTLHQDHKPRIRELEKKIFA
jgi:hypothetical protein